MLLDLFSAMQSIVMLSMKFEMLGGGFIFLLKTASKSIEEKNGWFFIY
jgi:hypothetical protein